ncbi:MAG: hypothetical protein Q7S09_04200 [bacterium]|nr:hypothetical protein [bacterium]
MNYKQSKTLLLGLLACKTSDEVEQVLAHDPLATQWEWLPYGGRTNNVGIVEGQMHEPDNALMEKITNSIDAILMRRCYEEGIDPRDKTKAPQSMTEAIEKFFGGKEKLREKRSEFGKEWLRLTAEGKKDRPTITIIDKGEGQQPNMIKKTILSLSENNKENIPFVYGTYNQGGSSPLGYAGKPASYDYNYLQLILCRRPDTIKDRERASNYNHYGFSLVRKRFDHGARKFTYEYFAEKDTKEIFSFPQDEPIKIDDYVFTEGCLVKLFDYQLPQRGNIVFRGLNEFIEKKLPDAPLPIYMKELRDYGGGIEYTIFGLREKLLRKKTILRDGYPQRLPVDLGEIGKREIEVFVLKHKVQVEENLSSYLEQQEKIFFIKDGLVLHTENVSWLRNECDLVDLSPYLFAFVDISNINPPIAQMLHSGREKFKNNETTKLALERLKMFLGNETFKEIDKEYARLAFSSENSFKDEVLRKQLMKDIEKQPELRELFDLGNDLPTKEEKGPEDTAPYEGTYLPEKFELLGPDPREVCEGSFGKVTFETGADERLFERIDDRGEYDWENAEKFQVTFSSYKRGKITFRIDSATRVTAPEEEAVLFHLRVPSKGIAFSRAVTFSLKEKVPYVGSKFPSFFTPEKEIIEIPLGETRKMNLATDVENEYFDREKSPGRIELEVRKDLEFSKPKLKDGILTIKARFLEDQIREVDPIKFKVSDEAGHTFEINIPAKIVPPEGDPSLNLPKILTVERGEWNNDTPAWDENCVSRIPSWRELKSIKINLDSRPFDELKKIAVADREAARDLLIKQVYINSIWMFLEFRNLDVTAGSGENKYPDQKDEIFERGMRAASKIIIQNIKKFLR